MLRNVHQFHTWGFFIALQRCIDGMVYIGRSTSVHMLLEYNSYAVDVRIFLFLMLNQP